MKLILDTNIFIAAGFNPRSGSARIIKAIRTGKHKNIWHKKTLYETRKLLRQIPPLDWHKFADLFRPEWECSTELNLKQFKNIKDPDDRKFASLAQVTNATLVSNDRHLLETRHQLPIKVKTPSELKKILFNR